MKAQMVEVTLPRSSRSEVFFFHGQDSPLRTSQTSKRRFAAPPRFLTP